MKRLDKKPLLTNLRRPFFAWTFAATVAFAILPVVHSGFKHQPSSSSATDTRATIKELLGSVLGDVRQFVPPTRDQALPRYQAAIPPNNPNSKELTWNQAQQKRLHTLRWQSRKQLEARIRPENGTVRFLKGWRLEPVAAAPAAERSLEETTALNFLSKNEALLRIDDSHAEWTIVESREDKLGLTHVKFEQRFAEYEVWPSSLTVEVDKTGNVTELQAAYSPTPKTLNLTPTLNLEGAKTRALAFLQDRGTAISNAPHIEDQKLLIHGPIETEPELAYSFHFHEHPGLAWRVFVNAHSGQILSAFNHVCSAAAQGSGVDVQGTPQVLELWQDGSSFTMVNTTKSMFDAQRSNPPGFDSTFGGISIYDAKNISPINNPDAFNPELVSSTSSTQGFGPNAVSAAVNLSRVYDYYESRHQRLSIDGRGGSIVGVINVPINNAYWQNDIITFGNEDSWAHALDFAGHEMTHGIIEKSAGLIYQNQPGALNEAFADIFGESVEAFFHNGSPDWKLGTLLSKPLRDMRNPGSMEIGLGRSYPSRMSEFIPPSDSFLDNFDGRDNGGVHLNSSVINHAFYQLAEGLQGAVGLLSAERIFYRALTTKLQKQSQFLDCRIACVSAAEELFGAGSNEVQQTHAAFNAVEIFDQRPPDTEAEPAPLPTVGGSDSTLFTFVSPLDGQTYLARQESEQNDDPGGILLVGTPVAPGKRPVVSRDGSVALFVTADFSLGLVDTQTGETAIFGEPNSVWSVGLSPDASYLGFVLAENDQPENVIRVVNIETEAVEELTLKAPALDGGATDTILFADVLNFTPNNETIYYDALNRITFSDGSQFDTWSIFAIHRRTGATLSVVPPLPDLSIGNPSLGRIDPNHLVFEAGDLTTGISHIFTQDLTSGTQTEVAAINATAGLAFPDFFGDDSAVLYSDYAFDAFGFLSTSGLSRQPLAEDGLRPQGLPSVWLIGSAAGANIGTIYRRGEYVGLNTVTVQSATQTVSEDTSAEALFTLTREGSTANALIVSYLLTGSARPNEDYSPVPLVAKFEVGKTETTVTVPVIDDLTAESEEHLTLTLSGSQTYAIGTPGSATITIHDNDTEAPDGYPRWAAENNIQSPTADADGDGLVNLLEYALGTNPQQKNEAPTFRSFLMPVNGTDYLAIELSRKNRRDDITYTLEATEDFATWIPAPPSLDLLEDRAERLLWRSKSPILTHVRQYYRIVVSLR